MPPSPESNSEASSLMDSIKGLVWSVTGMNMMAGTLSGIAGVFAGHPFDTIKVRLQSQPHPSSGAVRYRNTWHCFTSIIREERITGLFKGVTSPLVGVTAVNTLLFGVYGYFIELQMKLHAPKIVIHDDSTLPSLEVLDEDITPTTNSPPSPTLQQIFIAGAGSGFVNSFISGPVELAKIQLQNQTSKSARGAFQGPTQCLRQVYRQSGIGGLYKGLFLTMLRETPSYAVYFMTFEGLSKYWINSMAEQQGLLPGDIQLSSGRLMMAGGLSGIAAWLSTYPVDVIKTRLQAQPLFTPPTIGYLVHQVDTKVGTLGCARQILREEGIAGMFRGLTATLIRAFPTNAVIFTSYALTMRWLEAIKPIESNNKENV